MSDPEEIYQQLAQVFTDRHDIILEIEILPPGVGPILQDGCSIGISKQALVQCFVIARQIFIRGVHTASGNTSEYSADHEDIPLSHPNDAAVSIASQIILLFDCEHLTACNWRKRWLESTTQRNDVANAGHTERERLVETFETELTLMTTYLNSPLHRHTKSPTLWQHRFWVLARIIRAQALEPADISTSKAVASRPPRRALDAGTSREVFVAELDIALRAGELHPKNYYAFSYMRQLHGILSKMEGGYDQLARAALPTTLDWCLAHPRDISGWMLTLYFLEAIHDEEIRVETVKRVVRFALDVGWDGEGLWTFVDLAARMFGLVETVLDMLRTCSGTTQVDSVVTKLPGDDMMVPEKPWKAWVAQVRAYWAAGGQ